MIQNKICTEVGGGLLNLDVSLDHDIEYEYLQSNGTSPKPSPPQQKKYRSNLTVRHCSAISILDLDKYGRKRRAKEDYDAGESCRTVSESNLTESVVITATPQIEEQKEEEERVAIDELQEEEELHKRTSSLSLHESVMSRTPQMEKRYKNGTRHSMTFTNDKVREIERVNRILLKKIMDQKRPTLGQGTAITPRTFNSPALSNRDSHASVNRRKQQRQIDIDNAILERRIRLAKPVTKTRRH